MVHMHAPQIQFMEGLYKHSRQTKADRQTNIARETNVDKKNLYAL